MEKPAPSDPELLAAWLGKRSDPAFHAIVARYAGLVHATARRTCGDDSIAAEASQLTFIALARKAKSLTSCASLGGWLHATAMMQAKNLIRKSQRENRKRQLLQSSMETESPHASNDVWQEMQPVLDDALASLSAKDREALLLRFYRSLSVRETAATLGIATDAAQKRIDRATERLRGKLARRGCQAGSAMGAAMIAGFAADAQAAVPGVSLIASKAMAASATGTGVFSASTFLTTAAMKSTSAVIPFVGLLISGILISSQFRSIASLEQQNAHLLKSLAADTGIVSVSQKRAAPVKTPLDKKPIDWEEVARQFKQGGEGSGAYGYLSTTQRLEAGFVSMSREELIAALDEIAVASLSADFHALLESKLIDRLVGKDPEYVLKRFIGRLHDDDWVYLLASAMGQWSVKDPEKAMTWCDEQIAAGTFQVKSLRVSNELHYRFEAAFIDALLPVDPGLAGKRLATIPLDDRIQVIKNVQLWRNDEMAGAFANLLRQQLPEKDHLDLISWPVSDMSERSTVPYSYLKDYLVRIQATPAERDECILTVANCGLIEKSDDRAADIEVMRTWIRNEAPELVDRATGQALAQFGRFIYPEMAGIALRYHEAGAGDEVLIPLLESDASGENEKLARALAAKLADGKLREKFLEKFK